MKYIVGSFLLYILATGKWKTYSDFASVDAPSVAEQKGMSGQIFDQGGALGYLEKFLRGGSTGANSGL